MKRVKKRREKKGRRGRWKPLFLHGELDLNKAGFTITIMQQGLDMAGLIQILYT